MKLIDLLKAIASTGEVMTDEARRTYVANVEKLEREGTTLPGNPSKLLVVPGSTLMPERVKTSFKLRAWLQGDDIVADFAQDRSRSSWWRRNPGAVMDVTVEWKAHEPPEAVARTRVIGENQLQDELTTTKWSTIGRASTEPGTDKKD